MEIWNSHLYYKEPENSNIGMADLHSAVDINTHIVETRFAEISQHAPL